MHKLRQFRKTHKLSQQDVAAKVGVNFSMIHHWEKGTRTPRLIHIRKIQEITNGQVTADDFEPQQESA